MMQQLGVIPPPESDAPSDASQEEDDASSRRPSGILRDIDIPSRASTMMGGMLPSMPDEAPPKDR